MAKKFKKFIQNYLSKKISAEIKSCLTFLLLLCFYCIYKWICGIKEVSIIHMLEIVCTAYVLEWIQILLHFDFEDIEKLKIKEWLIIIIASSLYAGLSYLFGWFEGNLALSAIFLAYVIVVYLCIFLVHKIKRNIDAKLLNNDLNAFKERN